jgi:hypothetical protein
LYFFGVFVTFRGADCRGHAFPAEEGMRKKIKPVFGPGIEVDEVSSTWGNCVAEDDDVVV